jgi:endonuclease/exonuclease/phosphatase family metal-dependent hydrolase
VVDQEYKGRRDAYVMHLRVRATGAEFTLVAIHLKSGLPDAGPDDRDAKIRLRETTFLASWLDGTLDVKLEPLERPPTADVIIMGDCNATEGSFSLEPLRKGRHYQPCQVAASLDPAAPFLVDDPTEQWSTFLDRAIIDHAFVSPTLSPKISLALIYAFDLDPALDEDPAGGGHWLRRVTGYRVEPWEGAGVRPVENLYRISDHRPLRVTLDLA